MSKLPTRPSKLPRWASSIKKSELTGMLNVYEPPEAQKDEGWPEGFPPPRQWANWLHKSTYDWIEYLDLTGRVFICTKAELPKSVESKGMLFFVTDLEGGALALSNGLKWRYIKLTNSYDDDLVLF